MVRLNRHTLTQRQQADLLAQLADTISPQDPATAQRIVRELCGHEEQIMLAKRLAAVVLLVEGISMYKAAQLLRLSQSTVEHIARKLERGHFAHTLAQVSKTQQQYQSFLDTLDAILHLGGLLPHYSGLDRYRFLK